MRAACCARSPTGLTPTRESLQIGAEIYGHAGHRGRSRGDRAAAVVAAPPRASRDLHLDLGHVGVYRALASGAGIAGNGDDSDLFDALRAKDVPAVARADGRDCPRPGATRSPRCPTLYGPRDDVLRGARAQLPDTPSIANALDGARGARALPPRRRSRPAHRSRRPARLSLPQRRDLLGVHRRAMPDAIGTAAATTTSARRSAARGRRPASRSICASSPMRACARIGSSRGLAESAGDC